MSDYKKLISGFTEKDYESGCVNLHIHTACSDGKSEFLDVVEYFRGLKYFAITDHNTVAGYINNENLPENLITGVEFDVWYGYVFCHLLALGIGVNSEYMKPFYAKEGESGRVLPRLFNRRNMKNLIEAIHKSGGIAVLAHPACYWALSMDRLIKNLKNIGLDGVECYYPYAKMRGIVKFHSKNSVIRAAQKYDLIKTGGNDFHG